MTALDWIAVAGVVVLHALPFIVAAWCWWRAWQLWRLRRGPA